MVAVVVAFLPVLEDARATWEEVVACKGGRAREEEGDSESLELSSACRASSSLSCLGVRVGKGQEMSGRWSWPGMPNKS